MQRDRAIKIIKRAHRTTAEEPIEPGLKTENEIRREILSTISSWVEHQREVRKELHRLSGVFKRETFVNPLFASFKKAESGPELP